MSAKKKQPTQQIVNRRARFDYELGDSLEVGLQLTGAEVKSLRLNRGELRGAYVTDKAGELWLIGARISGAGGVKLNEDEQIRTRKLLAKRREIDRLLAAKKQGMSIVPLSLKTDGRFIKLRLSLGKGKKRYDKREVIRKREQQRSIDRLQ